MQNKKANNRARKPRNRNPIIMRKSKMSDFAQSRIDAINRDIVTLESINGTEDKIRQLSDERKGLRSLLNIKEGVQSNDRTSYGS